MVWRRRVIFTRSSRAASSAGTGARGAAAAGAGAAAGAAGACAARATSSFITRPSRPVPVTASRLRPASAIAFFAEGRILDVLRRGGGGAGASGRGVMSTGPSAGTGCPGVSETAGAGPPATTGVMVASLALAETVEPSGRKDRRQHARGGRGHLDRDLVGFQFAQHLVLRHGIARLLEPGRDRRLGHAFAQRRNHHVDHLALSRAGPGHGGFRCLNRRGGLGHPFAHLRQKGRDADRRAFGRHDFHERARDGAGHLDRHLVGLQLAQHLVDRDGVAHLLEPGGDGRLGHAFAQRGDADLNCHPCPRTWRRA